MAKDGLGPHHHSNFRRRRIARRRHFGHRLRELEGDVAGQCRHTTSNGSWLGRPALATKDVARFMGRTTLKPTHDLRLGFAAGVTAQKFAAAAAGQEPSRPQALQSQLKVPDQQLAFVDREVHVAPQPLHPAGAHAVVLAVVHLRIADATS